MTRTRRLVLGLLLGTLAALASGCGDATGILIDVTSPDLAVPADVDTLRFEVFSTAGRSLDETFHIPGPLPQSLTVSRFSSADDEVIVRVTASRDGAFVVRRVVRATFVPGFTRRIEVVLTRACVGVMCGENIDCVAGMCTGEPPPDDAGVDAGVDVDGGPLPDGGPDAGPFDGGMIDAGPPGDDAGPIDGGPPEDAGADGGMPDAGPTMLVCFDTPAACRGVIVISEFAPAGAGGAADEFFELYNAGGAAVDISGMRIEYSAHMANAWGIRATVSAGTVLPAGGFYLLGATSYTGPAPDQRESWSGLSASRGAIQLLAGGGGGVQVDLVGWHGGAEIPFSEGSPISPPSNFNGGESFERRANAGSTDVSMSPGGADYTAGNGHDTDDNAADFIVRTSREPQSSSSAPEP